MLLKALVRLSCKQVSLDKSRSSRSLSHELIIGTSQSNTGFETFCVTLSTGLSILDVLWPVVKFVSSVEESTIEISVTKVE